MGQFLRILGQLLEDIGYTCEARQLGDEHRAAHTQEEEENTSVMQRTVSTSRPTTDVQMKGEADTPAPSRTQPEPTSRGLREEVLSAEDLAIVDTFEDDET